MPLDCPSCHAPLGAKDVRLELALATCQSCGAVHDLSKRGAREPLSLRPRRMLPKRLRIDTVGECTRISWRWFDPRQHLFMAGWCLFWDALILGAYYQEFHKREPSLLALSFPLLHLIAGLCVTYYTLAGFLNRTRIEVEQARLCIHHGPLPWKGNLELRGRPLTQLYVRDTSTAKQKSYGLMGLDRDGYEVRLLSGLDDQEFALALEREVERHLGIEEAPVKGALEA